MALPLSIVTPVYNTASKLPELCRRLGHAAGQAASDFEIILVIDGSPDDALDVAKELALENQRIRIVDLSRNFGQHKAIMTGLEHARGQRIFVIDSDLDDDPAFLIRFWERMQAEPELDVVFGVQRVRRGGLLKRLPGECFYWLFNKVSKIRIPRNLLNCRLMTRRYRDALLRFRERDLLMSGLWSAAGFRQEAMEVDKLESPSTYTFSQNMRFMFLGLVSYSSLLLHLIFWLGLGIVCLSVLGIVYLILLKIFYAELMPMGWPSTIISIWFVGGCILLALGIQGLYISVIFNETKRRPYTIVRGTYGFDGDTPGVPEGTDAD